MTFIINSENDAEVYKTLNGTRKNCLKTIKIREKQENNKK
jgi:hypothetical protein